MWSRSPAAKTLRQQLESIDGLRDVFSLGVRRIERYLRARVKNWRMLLGRQVPIARQIVTKLLEGRHPRCQAILDNVLRQARHLLR
jgi:hypothetical protein